VSADELVSGLRFESLKQLVAERDALRAELAEKAHDIGVLIATLAAAQRELGEAVGWLRAQMVVGSPLPGAVRYLNALDALRAGGGK